MKSINTNVKNEIVINKSKFITYLYKVNSIEEINKYLDNFNKEYKDATHICYAYIIDNYKKASDDAEPSGTAGLPILNVLEKNELNYILAVVIRYFGGIKLGAGGLVRAYSSSITECLSKTNIIELIDGFLIRITINYENINTIDNLLKDVDIKYKEYDELITYEFEISKNSNLIDLIKKNSTSFTILDNIKITKKD